MTIPCIRRRRKKAVSLALRCLAAEAGSHMGWHLERLLEQLGVTEADKTRLARLAQQNQEPDELLRLHAETLAIQAMTRVLAKFTPRMMIHGK